MLGLGLACVCASSNVVGILVIVIFTTGGMRTAVRDYRGCGLLPDTTLWFGSGLIFCHWLAG